MQAASPHLSSTAAAAEAAATALPGPAHHQPWCPVPGDAPAAARQHGNDAAAAACQGAAAWQAAGHAGPDAPGAGGAACSLNAEQAEAVDRCAAFPKMPVLLKILAPSLCVDGQSA